MNKYIIESKLCSGCKACKQICPNNAIDIIQKDGFEYPIKNNNCIECGLCKKICPMQNTIQMYNKLDNQEVYTCSHKDEKIVQKSSSGGAFTAIAQVFCDKDYIIFGAQYNEKFDVEHDYIEDINEIHKFRKSKYVQSDIKDNYQKAKEFLNQGKKVLFSGTPCQIGGLKNYLKREYDNLLCIDIICHGVPSPKVFKKYRDFIETKYKSKIKNINFREKNRKNGKWNSRNILIEFENGKKIVKNSNEDLYLRVFYNNLMYRESCKYCKFANPVRYSDITIADSWGIEKKYPDIDVHKGESLVVVNTSKGKEVFNKVMSYMNVRNLTLDFAKKENKNFREPTTFNKNREEFFLYLDDMKFDKLVNKYAKIGVKTKIKRTISNILPNKLQNTVKKIVKEKNA